MCRISKERRVLPSLHLNGNPLPWVRDGIHLGNNFQNQYDGLKKDILIKRANFINKSCELDQEFHFANPDTIMQLNRIYNLHFTGSPLWDLFGPEMLKLEKSWNVAVRKIFKLPYNTHKYFIEPTSKMCHFNS